MQAMSKMWLVTTLVLALSASGCASEGDTDLDETPEDPAGTAVDDPGPDETTDGKTEEEFKPEEGGPGCQFDEAKVGNIIGKHIENYTLKTYQGDPYSLHQNCGDEQKAVWIILSTGW